MNREIRKKEIEKTIDMFKGRMMELSSGADGAYLAFAVTGDGQQGLTFGGRVDLMGVTISNVLAHLVYQTPGLDESYLDVINNVAKSMLEDIESESGTVQ